MTLRERVRGSAGIQENDPVLAAARAAADVLDARLGDSAYTHTLGELATQSGIFEVLGKGALPADIWKRKLRTLAAIVVTDTAYPFDPGLVPPDRLGFFFTSIKGALVADLQQLGVEQEAAQAMKTAVDKHRNVLDADNYPIIALERNALSEIAKTETQEDLVSVVRFVLWHELGHLIFNPDLSVEPIDQRLKKPQKGYLFCKAMHSLIEGSAEWFAFTAEAWNTRTKEICADIDWASESPYSYAAALLVMPPRILAPILVSLLFNCVRSALWYLPVARDGLPLKLEDTDFPGLPFRGRDFISWHGFADYIAGGVDGLELGFSDLEAMADLAPELVREDVVSEEVLTFFGLDDLEAQGKSIDFSKTVHMISMTGATGNRFDDLLLYAGERHARLWIGLNNRRTYRYMIAFSTEEDVARDQQGWYVMLQLKLFGQSKFDIFVEQNSGTNLF